MTTSLTFQIHEPTPCTQFSKKFTDYKIIQIRCKIIQLFKYFKNIDASFIISSTNNLFKYNYFKNNQIVFQNILQVLLILKWNSKNIELFCHNMMLHGYDFNPIIITTYLINDDTDIEIIKYKLKFGPFVLNIKKIKK